MVVSLFMFTITLKNKLLYFLLLTLLILAFFLRINKITQIPPSLSWDEVAVGYNAWTIANYGRDEWGHFMPAYFKSFLDDKHPVHIYVTAFFVKLLGLNDFSVRLPAVILGVANILLIFLLGRILFKSNLLGLIAAFLLTISPYALHYSRFNHELNFAIFFFLLGLNLFFYGLKRKNILLSFSFLSLGISFLTYHSSEIVVSIVLIYLNLVYFKQLKQLKGYYLIGILFLGLIIILVSFNPALLGFARVSQTSFSTTQITNTYLYKTTQNQILGRANVVYNQYFLHFSKDYLFLLGDKNPRLSDQSSGEFFIFDGLFLIVGTIGLLLKKTKESLLILLIAVIAPLPSSLAQEAPHAARAMFMLGSWHLIIAYGIYLLTLVLRKKALKVFVLIFILFIYGYFFSNYLTKYYSEYSKKYAVDWQYGMKDIVSYVKDHPEYKLVYMTNVRFQPYIFFLYYLKYPLPKYLASSEFNYSDSRSYNLIYRFDKFIFDGWDPIESSPANGVLYIVSASQYDGLRYKASLKVKKIIPFPDGGDAFFLVSVS